MTDTLQIATLDREWRLEYRNRRYLEHQTSEQLQERFEDLFRNAYFCGRDGRIYSKGDDTKWVRWMSHVLEELTLRMMRGPLLPKLTRYRNAARAAELWDKLKLNKNTYLLKFGESKYMRPLWEKGRLTVFPATKYDNPTLNEAIRDDELTLMQQSCRATINSLQDWRTGIRHDFDRPVPIIGPLKQETRYESNCYMACFGRRYEYRLFDDFGYDSCLVIREPQLFVERIRACMALAVPGWDFCAAAVSYRDPCHPTPTDDVLFSKHFRFTYQKEFRTVWEGPTRQGTLEPIPLDLGSLIDYCDLLVL